MLWELIAIGGILSWCFAIGVIGVLIAALEYENGWYAFWTTVVALCILTLFSDFNVLEFIGKITFADAFWFIGVYVVGGSIWGMVKWYFYCLNIRNRYDELKEKTLKRWGITDGVIPNDKKRDWAEKVECEFGYGNKIPPQASENKATILLWMCYWPLSGFWTLLNDPLKHIWRWVYRRVSGTMQRISNHMFRDTSADFEITEEVNLEK